MANGVMVERTSEGLPAVHTLFTDSYGDVILPMLYELLRWPNSGGGPAVISTSSPDVSIPLSYLGGERLIVRNTAEFDNAMSASQDLITALTGLKEQRLRQGAYDAAAKPFARVAYAPMAVSYGGTFHAAVVIKKGYAVLAGMRDMSKNKLTKPALEPIPCDTRIIVTLEDTRPVIGLSLLREHQCSFCAFPWQGTDEIPYFLEHRGTPMSCPRLQKHG